MAERLSTCPPELAQPGRLTRAADIRAVLRARRVVRGEHVDVYVRDAPARSGPRLTVVAGKRVGNAVSRNRAKRRLRAAVRESGMPAGRDAVLVAKAGAQDAPFRRLVDEVSPVRNRTRDE